MGFWSNLFHLGKNNEDEDYDEEEDYEEDEDYNEEEDYEEDEDYGESREEVWERRRDTGLNVPRFNVPRFNYHFEEDSSSLSDIFKSLTKNMAIDVLWKNQVIFSAKLASVRNDSMGGELILERLPGCADLDILPLGEDVTIWSYDRQMAQICITAIVRESSKMLCKLTDIRMSDMDNPREQFRICTDTPIQLFRPSDEKCMDPEECTLINISTGGCCVESEYVHEEGELLWVKFKLQGHYLQSLGQIVWASLYDGGRYRHGILFTQLESSERDLLTRVLYAAQAARATKLPQTRWS